MKKILTTFTLSVAAFMGVTALAGETADSLTASDAFVRMPAQTLDILTTSMRLDLLDYYRADSIYRVPNVMEGLSYLHRPLTRDYVKVQITPVTTLTLRMMPWKRRGLEGPAIRSETPCRPQTVTYGFMTLPCVSWTATDS